MVWRWFSDQLPLSGAVSLPQAKTDRVVYRTSDPEEDWGEQGKTLDDWLQEDCVNFYLGR
jgi:hypothetical protein